jgi:predicted aminopeptidase
VRSRTLVFFALGALTFLSGCSDLGYYWQAASGHLELLGRKQDIQELLDSPHTSAELKRKLNLVKSVRTFAVQQLSFPDNQGYTGYVELDRPYVTMVVTAAPPLELKAHQWCYWFVGCQEYRGYFEKEHAREYAQELQQQKLDVSVSPVTAYSTLGWLNKSWLPDYFSDPVISTFLRRHDAELITVLIHEMAHQVVYVSNDTSFNESFAVFVEQQGLKQYLDVSEIDVFIKDDREELFQWYLKASKDRELFRNLINSAFEKIEKMFASDLSNADKLQKKQQLFDQLQDSYKTQKKNFQVLSYDNWFAKELNNTHLLSVKRYHSQVEKFEHLFDQQGKDWNRFFEAVRELADVSSEERQHRMSLLN